MLPPCKQYVEWNYDGSKGYSTVVNCYESRGSSVIRLLSDFVDIFAPTIPHKIVVSTEDVPSFHPHPQFVSFFTTTKEYDEAFPCFLFDKWPQIGVEDYDALCANIRDVTSEPLHNKIGWIGVILCPARQALCAYGASHSSFCDFRHMNWCRSDPNNLPSGTQQYMSLPEQCATWRYLLDVRGNGWSARAKLLFHSNRVVFLVNRPYEEFWFQHLVPWVNYVPVKSDLSDLEENFIRLSTNPVLEKYIIHNQHVLADSFLTRHSAINQVNTVIQSVC